MDANVTLTGHDSDKLILNYPAVKQAPGYSAPAVRLEFGARATGQPHSIQSVICDIVTFPQVNTNPSMREKSILAAAFSARLLG